MEVAPEPDDGGSAKHGGIGGRRQWISGSWQRLFGCHGKVRAHGGV